MTRPDCSRVRVAADEDEVDDILMPLDADDRIDRWDCETILTTYSNLENHPRLIRARDRDLRKKQAPVAKIHLDPRTGLPSVVTGEDADVLRKPKGLVSFASHSDSEPSDDDQRSTVGTIKRDRNEPKDAKKARKAAVKEGKQARRAEKKATKELFGAELKTQNRVLGNKERKLKSL